MRKLIICASFIIINLSSFAQTTAWYIGAFSADDGSKMLVTESQIYLWPAQGNGYILYHPKVDWYSDGGMMTASEMGKYDYPFSDPGFAEFQLTTNNTIDDFGTEYKKNPSLIASLRNEAQKLDQKAQLSAEKTIHSYTEFVDTNKWLQGIWTMPSPGGPEKSYLFIFPQGVYFIDASLDESKVFQLEPKAEIVNSDDSRRLVTKNDTRGSVYLCDFFSINLNSRTITFYTGDQLKKVRL